MHRHLLQVVRKIVNLIVNMSPDDGRASYRAIAVRIQRILIEEDINEN